MSMTESMLNKNGKRSEWTPVKQERFYTLGPVEISISIYRPRRENVHCSQEQRSRGKLVLEGGGASVRVWLEVCIDSRYKT